MAVTSGSYTTNSVVSPRKLTFNWSLAGQSVSGNYSDINWNLVGSGGGSSWISGKNFRQWVDGNYYSNASTVQVWDGTVILSGTTRIYHGTDGRKSFGANTIAQMYNYVDNTSGSGVWELPQIPRQADITSAPDFNDADNPTIYFNNAGGFNVRCYMEFAGQTIDKGWVGGVGQYTFNLTEAERNLLRSSTPNSTTMSVRYVVQTDVSGNTNYFSFVDRTFYVNNQVPVLNDFAYQDTNATTIALTGSNQIIVNGKSNLKVYNITATSYKYATKKNIVIDGTSDTWSDTYNKTINSYSKNNIGVAVVDSRNLTSATVTKTMTFKDYFNIVKADQSYSRSNSGVGELVTFVLNGSWWNANFGAVANILTPSYRYKQTGSSTWITGTTAITLTKTGNSYSLSQALKGDTTTGFNIANAYDVEIILTDKLSTVTFAYTVTSGTPAMAVMGNKIAFGGSIDENATEDIQVKKTLKSIAKGIFNGIRTGFVNFDRYSNYDPDDIAGTGGMAGITNDNNVYKALMLLGNNSAGNGRQIRLWDDVTVDRHLNVSGHMNVNDYVNFKGGTITGYLYGNAGGYLSNDMNLMVPNYGWVSSLWDNKVDGRANNISGFADSGTYLHVNRMNGGAKGINWWDSDYRLKGNFKKTEVNALETIGKIKHRAFTKYTSFDKKEIEKEVNIGYIAQDLKQLDKQLVFDVTQENGDNILNINTTVLIPYITKAIQEQQEIIEKQQKIIEDLDRRLKLLEEKGE